MCCTIAEPQSVRRVKVLASCAQDPYNDVRNAMEFLESKRTSVKLTSLEGRLGHMPQEDFAEALAPLLRDYCDGVDVTVAAKSKRFSKAEYEASGAGGLENIA
jgi:hypothetical protein